MKRISILFLGFAIALIAVSGASAKTKAPKNDSESIPSVKTIDKLMDKINLSKHPEKVAAPAGMKLLVTRVIHGDINDVLLMFGNNANVSNFEESSYKITTTGPHAWYLRYEACGGVYFGIFFSSEADRDAYWQEYKKHSSYFDKSLFESDGTKPYFTTEDEWYGINLEPY